MYFVVVIYVHVVDEAQVVDVDRYLGVVDLPEGAYDIACKSCFVHISSIGI